MTWTRFYDVSSGGFEKTEYKQIFIEAPQDEAIEIFESRIGRSPWNVTCQCCGPDHSITEYDSLEAATKFDRELPERLSRGNVIPLEDYLESEHILVIPGEEV